MGFSDDIKKFKGKTVMRLAEVKKAVAIKLFNSIVLDTPVLTGRLRANWMISINEPDGSVSWTVEDKTGQMMFGVIRREVGRARGDDTIIMRNNLPYCYRIEYEGWSWQKSPLGMVRRNAVRFDQLLKAALKDAKSGGFSSTYQRTFTA